MDRWATNDLDAALDLRLGRSSRMMDMNTKPKYPAWFEIRDSEGFTLGRSKLRITHMDDGWAYAEIMQMKLTASGRAAWGYVGTRKRGWMFRIPIYLAPYAAGRVYRDGIALDVIDVVKGGKLDFYIVNLERTGALADTVLADWLPELVG